MERTARETRDIDAMLFEEYCRMESKIEVGRKGNVESRAQSQNSLLAGEERVREVRQKCRAAGGMRRMHSGMPMGGRWPLGDVERAVVRNGCEGWECLEL